MSITAGHNQTNKTTLREFTTRPKTNSTVSNKPVKTVISGSQTDPQPRSHKPSAWQPLMARGKCIMWCLAVAWGNQQISNKSAAPKNLMWLFWSLTDCCSHFSTNTIYSPSCSESSQPHTTRESIFIFKVNICLPSTSCVTQNTHFKGTTFPLKSQSHR